MSITLGVLISGSGTNLQALIDRIAEGRLDAKIALVVSSRASAYGLKRAEAAGIQTLTLSKTANYGGSDNLIFQYTVPQFIANQYTLDPATPTSGTQPGRWSTWTASPAPSRR